MIDLVSADLQPGYIFVATKKQSIKDSSGFRNVKASGDSVFGTVKKVWGPDCWLKEGDSVLLPRLHTQVYVINGVTGVFIHEQEIIIRNAYKG